MQTFSEDYSKSVFLNTITYSVHSIEKMIGKAFSVTKSKGHKKKLQQRASKGLNIEKLYLQKQQKQEKLRKKHRTKKKYRTHS